MAALRREDPAVAGVASATNIAPDPARPSPGSKSRGPASNRGEAGGRRKRTPRRRGVAERSRRWARRVASAARALPIGPFIRAYCTAAQAGTGADSLGIADP